MANGFEKLGIGPDKPPKLILDFCWNHEGSIGRVRQMLEALRRELYKEAGQYELLDLVIPKFQAGRDLPWSRAMYRGVKKMCEDEFGLPFLCTAFDYKAVDMLDSLGVVAIKIGSAEACDMPFIEHVISTGRPVIVSTGGISDDEVRDLKWAHWNLLLMHCVSAYPPVATDLSLAALDTFCITQGGPPVFDGYSSHYVGLEDAYFAMALGAQVIEKHYSLTPRITDQPGAGTDHAVSIGPHHVRTLCEASLLWHKMRGTTKSQETLEAERALLQPFRERFHANNHKGGQNPREAEVESDHVGRIDREQS